MESFPAELCVKIFSCLDHKCLAAALQGSGMCWGQMMPCGIDCSRRDGVRNGLPRVPPLAQNRGRMHMREPTIIREGDCYYTVYQGKIQSCLGSRAKKRRIGSPPSTMNDQSGQGQNPELEETSSPPSPGTEVVDKMLFVLGDLQMAMIEAGRSGLL
ncbi:hypothetical protein SAY87_030788 [Trapa incisa]|uniref:F-box protein n=1 Tax=Trapa incisa TaxID=236973 RepID=A0AAN7KVV2_9MYRT|nr:hypothetical protein SAY87_030788 [Trapa incisa]